jgi:hypothetical protein
MAESVVVASGSPKAVVKKALSRCNESLNSGEATI